MSIPIREKIGSFWIGTGVILLTDPSQVIPTIQSRSPPLTYEDFRELFYAQGTLRVLPALGCDGWYPVYVEKGPDGAVQRIIIECGGQVTL